MCYNNFHNSIVRLKTRDYSVNFIDYFGFNLKVLMTVIMMKCSDLTR